MGERVRELMRAFDGRALDWRIALGAGFASAPKGHLSVYREASREELHRIVREGIVVPPPEFRHPEMRAEMELLDKHRPARMMRRGVSRLHATYATPTPETPRLSFRKEHFVLEMKVDPTESFVGDMDFITCLIPFITAARNGLEKYEGAFSKYWDSVIPLADFKKHYEQVGTGDGEHWVRREGAPAKLPQSYFAPEILVMTPMISQRHVRVVGHEKSAGGHAEQYDDEGYPYEGY
ncbi:MAG: hypothetical protein RLZZ324_185 [Candidatus Parcubacteria bacterium]|jgi:hypothetical protein